MTLLSDASERAVSILRTRLQPLIDDCDDSQFGCSSWEALKKELRVLGFKVQLADDPTEDD